MEKSTKFFEILDDLNNDLKNYGWDDNIDHLEEEYIKRTEKEIKNKIEKCSLIERIKNRIDDFYLST